MKLSALILGAGLGLILLTSSAGGQELRLELARKRSEAVQPAPEAQAVVRQAEQAIQEYEEQVGRERLIQEHVLARDRRPPNLDPVITQQLQAIQIQRTLRR
jgi:hypothetical protein